MTIPRYLASVQKIRNQMAEVGIPSKWEYDAGMPDNMMSLSLPEERKSLIIKVPECDNVEEKEAFQSIELNVLDKSKKFRQVLLNVKEKARSLTKTVTSYTTPYDKLDLIAEFPIVFNETNGDVKWDVSDVRALDGDKKVLVADWIEYDHGESSGSVDHWEAEVTAHVPASDSYFMIGFDEKHMFVCMLPRRAKTLKEAKVMLMPKEIRRKKNVVRQGEFFFVPVNPKELKAINAIVVSQDNGDGEYAFKADIGGTDHTATELVTDHSMNEFANGLVYNDRHRTHLNGWHKVYRNTEIEAPEGVDWD